MRCSAPRTWPTHRGGSRTPDGRKCGRIRHLGSRPRRARGAIGSTLSCRDCVLESARAGAFSTGSHTNTCSARAPCAPGRAGGSSCAVTASHPLKSSRNARCSTDERGNSDGRPPLAARPLSSASGSPVPPPPPLPSTPLSPVQLGVAPRRNQAGAAGWRAASARQLPHMPATAWQAARCTKVVPCGPATTPRRTATQAGASNVQRSHSSAAGMTVRKGSPPGSSLDK